MSSAGKCEYARWWLVWSYSWLAKNTACLLRLVGLSPVSTWSQFQSSANVTHFCLPGTWTSWITGKELEFWIFSQETRWRSLPSLSREWWWELSASEKYYTTAFKTTSKEHALLSPLHSLFCQVFTSFSILSRRMTMSWIATFPFLRSTRRHQGEGTNCEFLAIKFAVWKLWQTTMSSLHPS